MTPKLAFHVDCLYLGAWNEDFSESIKHCQGATALWLFCSQSCLVPDFWRRRAVTVIENTLIPQLLSFVFMVILKVV